MEAMEETMTARLINHIRRTNVVFTTKSLVDSINDRMPLSSQDREAEQFEHEFNAFNQK